MNLSRISLLRISLRYFIVQNFGRTCEMAILKKEIRKHFAMISFNHSSTKYQQNKFVRIIVHIGFPYLSDKSRFSKNLRNDKIQSVI